MFLSISLFHLDVLGSVGGLIRVAVGLWFPGPWGFTNGNRALLVPSVVPLLTRDNIPPSEETLWGGMEESKSGSVKRGCGQGERDS